LRGVAQPG